MKSVSLLDVTKLVVLRLQSVLVKYLQFIIVNERYDFHGVVVLYVIRECFHHKQSFTKVG